MEEWKQVPEFPEYHASTLGRVKGIRRIITGSNNRGYLRTSARLNGVRFETSLHRLVALAFIPKVEGKNYVNHINGIRDDNRPDNLEWVTHSENIIHGIQVLGRENLILDESEVRIIRTAYQWGFTVKEIARARRLNRDTVRDVTANRCWKFVQM